VDTGAARAMFEKYACAMVYIEVRNQQGEIDIGSGFHVGEGVFVTARHVVDKCEVLEVGMTEQTYIPIENSDDTNVFISKGGVNQPVHEVRNGILTLKRGPFLHQDSAVDVAVFQVEQIDPMTPVVRLGDHLDDWLGESDFVLTEAIILGYPRIPKAKRPTLVGTRAEVSTIVDRYDAPHVHFVLSAMARGGFSGGIVLSEYGYALGVVTNSLGSDMKPAELGYMAAVGVEPIYNCLAQHKMLPDCQAEGWDDFWNTSRVDFGRELPPWNDCYPPGRLIVASVEMFDDGKRLHLEITCDDDSEMLSAAADRANHELNLSLPRQEIRPGTVKIEIPGPYDMYRDSVHATARSLVAFFEAKGYPIASDWLEQ
jgi:hypothetical protein